MENMSHGADYIVSKEANTTLDDQNLLIHERETESSAEELVAAPDVLMCEGTFLVTPQIFIDVKLMHSSVCDCVSQNMA